ncbi:alpha/beta fold hydrolase [Streptomyces sp. NPDC008092]|uniref:alpha/beta fold hydrolase n=1 Tax=Streptomyces sp. NPDC008092 TaxID=3364808 RepID=UPI0036E5E15F
MKYPEARTPTVEGPNGISHAFRRPRPGIRRPLIPLQHFRVNPDSRDPDLIIGSFITQETALVRPPPAGKRDLFDAIRQPALIPDGDDDRMTLPRHSHLAASPIPDAFVERYPDSAHGLLFQHAKQCGADVHDFLDAPAIGAATTKV